MKIYLFLFLFRLPFFISQTIYISPKTICQICDGTFFNPYRSLKEALASINSTQATIILFDGVYQGSNNTEITISQNNLKMTGFNFIFLCNY